MIRITSSPCRVARMLTLLVIGALSIVQAQDQRFYFPNQQQARFVQSFQTPSNGYYAEDVSPFRQNSPGFTQHQDVLEGDLQTSDLPPHLSQRLPQYQFSRFAQPTVQHPVPFQLPSKISNVDTYLYDDDNSKNLNSQVPRPQPFQAISKSATAKPSRQPHSHYIAHSGHGHDPSQTETFLGQITLQSPDLAPDFIPEIPSFRPSKEFPFQHSSSLVDQFSPGNEKWRKPHNVPVPASKPTRQRASNKPYRELVDAVDQNLEEFLDKESGSSRETGIINRVRKPSLSSVDRSNSNFLQSNSNNISSRFRSIPTSGRGEIKSRSQTNNLVVNTNGDVTAVQKHGFRPKPTTTQAPTTAAERKNRFHPSTRTPGKPLAFHLKSNKIPFAPKGRAATSTTENTFDLESLFEDPVKNGEHFEHDDDVEVIQSLNSASEVGTTTEQSETTTVTTENDKLIEATENIDHENSTHEETDSVSTESKEIETTDYSEEDIHTTLADEPSTHSSSATETESSVQGTTEPTVYQADVHSGSIDHNPEDEAHNEYEYEYEDDEEELHGTHLPHYSLETELPKVPSTEQAMTTKQETQEEESSTDISTTTEGPTSTVQTNFDVVTIKPTPQTVEKDNFNDFVDSTLIDNNSEEITKGAPEIITSEKPETTQDDKTTTEPTPTTALPSKMEPVLIGEAIVSVVTTKSVINGTYSVPTSQPQVTEQMKSPNVNNDSSSESWMVVASVQTSRSVSGARYLPFQPQGDDKRAQLLNEQPHDYADTDYTESEEQDSISENPIKHLEEIKISTPASSTESISDKLDRVQSELSSGFLSGGFRNGIAVITEQTPENTTAAETTTPSTTTTTQKPTTTAIPVIIRKFSANLRPSTTGRPHRKPLVFENIKTDDLAGLLPPGFKPKYQNFKTTTTTQSPLDSELPQGDEPAKDDSHNGTVGRSSGISTKNKIIIQDDISSFLPPGFKGPKESDLPKDPVKTLEDFLGKLNNRSRISNKPEHAKPKGPPVTTEKPAIEELLSIAEPVDISAFLPPGYKLPSSSTEKPKDVNSLLAKAEPIDISAFLPPGYKPPKEDKPKNATNVLAKAVPVDISAFLPPGYKAPKIQNDSKPSFNSNSNKPEKPKGVSGLLADAVPLDIGEFLPPGYKGRFTPSNKPTTAVTEEPTTTNQTEASNAMASTTASSGFKVVFPSRPGGRKPIQRLTTPKATHVGEGPSATAPSIQKGWPSRATTEFTGWPTPSTTPISIEKLLEAARNAASLTSSTETPTIPVTTSTTTTTTTTTLAPTTPGLCVGECDLAGTIRLVGGAPWMPELLDHNTKEWQILANEVQTQLEKAYSKSAILSKWYKKIRIEEFSPGSVLVDYTVELTDLGRAVDTIELKTLFNEALNAAPAGPTESGRRLENPSESIHEVEKNSSKLTLGSFLIDPKYTDFIVLSRNIQPTVGYADDNVLLPQWAIAVIVIGLASLLFVIIFGVTVLVNRQKNAKKKQPIPLTEEMLNELNKNHMGGLDNYGADDLYNMEDVWNDKAYDMKPPPKKRSTGSIHDNSMSNLYDSWRSEWNGYYYNAYYGNNANVNAGGSSNGGYTRRRSDYDTNF